MSSTESTSAATLSPPPARAFLDLLRQAEDGVLSHNLDDYLTELVKALQEHTARTNLKAVGTLTLKFTLSNDGKVIEEKAAVTMEKPKPIRVRSIFYATKDGRLTREHPQQFGLPLEVAETEFERRRAGGVQVTG